MAKDSRKATTIDERGRTSNKKIKDLPAAKKARDVKGGVGPVDAKTGGIKLAEPTNG